VDKLLAVFQSKLSILIDCSNVYLEEKMQPFCEAKHLFHYLQNKGSCETFQFVFYLVVYVWQV